MENKEKKKRKGKQRLLCWLLAAVMLFTGIPVQAAVSETENTAQNSLEGTAQEECADMELLIEEPSPNTSGNSKESLAAGTEAVQESALPEELGLLGGSADEKDQETVTGTKNDNKKRETLLTIDFYTNSGAGKPLKSMQVKPGTVIKLPDIPDSRFVNFGWTDTKSSTNVKYKVGASYKVNANTKLFLVRYAVSRVRTITFFGPTGSSNAQFAALKMTVVSGSTIKLPAVPKATGYENLGWSVKKNAKSASYAAGRTLKITKNLKLYAVRRKLPSYSVAFNNNSGTSKSKTYTALNKKIYKGEYITLPSVPKASGYINLGWTTTKKGKTVTHKAGSRVKVTRNLKFYAVRKKAVYYTAAFYTSNGSKSSTYKALNKRVLSGSTITLPTVPARNGYVNLGWSTRKNASSASYKTGAKIKITKNTRLYAVQKKQAQVVLHQNSGAVWKTYTMAEGDSFVLPGVQNKENYTMMGWSRTSGKSVAPDYQVGATLNNIKGTLHLYAVVFDRRTEPDYSAYELPQADLRTFKQIIFVGDSRTNRMANTLEQLGDSSLTSGITFLYKEGGGLSWLQNEGYRALLNKVADGNDSILQKRTAVIFNLGVNDLGNAYSYITFMRSIAPELQKKGCRLFYMSVNPINNEMIKKVGRNNPRKESDIVKFNSAIQSNLCSSADRMYTYIDCYGYLMANGYGTNRNREGRDENEDDGLHYTTKTYKRIYRFCMSEISKK